MSYENRHELIQGLGIGKLLARSSTLSADVFERLASIESNDVVFLSNSKAFYNQVYGALAQIPNRIKILLIELSSCVEHVFPQCCDCSPTYLLTSFLHNFHKSATYFRFSKFVVDYGTVTHQQAKHTT
jgi:hypothetical protein